MIYVFCGNDRVKIQSAVRKILGKDYEVFEGENLQVSDIYNICEGNTLFAETRKILVKDLTPARGGAEEKEDTSSAEDFYGILSKFTDTKHEIVIWESNAPNKKTYRDFIKNPRVKYTKLEKPKVDEWVAFRIYDTALRDGKRAVAELNKLLERGENGEEVPPVDPYMMVGAFSSSAMKNFERNPSARNRRILKELSKLDIKCKSTVFDPWTLIKVFLLKLATL